MQYPTLMPLGETRLMCSTFLGLDKGLKIPAGAFSHMENLTSDFYPAMSPRKKRSLYANGIALGLACADVLEPDLASTYHPAVTLCYPDAASGRLVIGDTKTDLVIANTTHKQLVSMGAYLLVLPDKKYINTLNLADYGKIEAQWSATADVVLTPCAVDGSDAGAEAVCVKLESPGIGKGFFVDDCVRLEHVSVAENLNGIVRIRKRGDDFVVIDGVLEAAVTQPWDAHRLPLTLERNMPDMDFVVECGNRLWGCRYGKDGSTIINQIFCSRLGDFRNWQSYQGLSTDSWAASLGSDGPFTGAATFQGHPLFFKENCLHKVHVSPTGAHQIVDTPCRGVQMHCGKSLAVVDETLYYKSAGGVMAYDGAFPRQVGEPLGDYRFGGSKSPGQTMPGGQYTCAVGGAAGSKYYLNLSDPQGVWQLLVYDTEKELWHREDSVKLNHMCAMGTELYGADTAGRILKLTGGGEENFETTVPWQAVTGDLELDDPDQKYVSGLVFRMSMEPGSHVDVALQYDHSGIWEPVCSLRGSRLGSFPVVVRPRRCDHLQLKLSGQGEMKLYSITKTVAKGSERT